MKGIIRICLAFALFTALVSCIPPVQVPGNSGPATLRAVLASLPDPKLTLPKSLSVTNSSQKGLGAKGFGDTTELTASSLNSLKSQAWMDLQSTSQNSFQAFLGKALAMIKDYASSHEISADRVFSIPVTDDDLVRMASMPDNMRGKITITTSFLIKGATAEDFKLYAKVTMQEVVDGQTMTFSAPCRLDVSRVGGRIKYSLYLNAAMAQGSQSIVQKIFAAVDAATGACTMVSQSQDAVDGPVTSTSLQKTEVGGGGTITCTNFSKYGDDSPSVYVAYGDDSAGGLASVSSSSWPDPLTGIPVEHTNYWGEYYNGGGDLLLRANGDTTIWPPVWDDSYYRNIKNLFLSPPDKLYVRPNGNGYDISADKATWQSFTGYGQVGSTWVYGIMHRQSTVSNTWTGGDTVYYWANRYPEGGFLVTEYAVGYRVPQPELKFGNSFYVTYEYPLKNLLPLTPAYAAAYKLTQEEKETSSWNWTDWEGKQQTSTYTNYNYYLNKIGGANAYDASEGDINLSDKLSSYDMYYWNPATSSCGSVKGYFLRTSGDIPPYFTVPVLTVRDRVDSQLQQALSSAWNVNLSEYQNDFTVVGQDPVFQSF